MPLSYKHAFIIRAFYQVLVAKKDPNDWYKKNVIDRLTFEDVSDIDITPETELPELTALPKDSLIAVGKHDIRGKHEIRGKTAVNLSGLKRQTLLPVMGAIAKKFIASDQKRATLAEKFTEDEIVEGLHQYIDGLILEGTTKNGKQVARYLVDELGYTREEIMKAAVNSKAVIALTILEQLCWIPQGEPRTWEFMEEDPDTTEALNRIIADDSYSLIGKSTLAQQMSIKKLSLLEMVA
jgi:hypothetical protein